MASLRDLIAQTLVARLAVLPGWVVQRGRRDMPSTLPVGKTVLAIVYELSESKRPANTEFYACTLRLGVVVRSGIENASLPLDDSNSERYLDRLVTQVEQVVHSEAWDDQVIASIEGHETAPPSEANVVEALVTVSIEYRHNFDDPTVYAPHYTDA